MSKRRIYEKDKTQCEDRFAKAKAINSILMHISKQLGYQKDEELEELYDKTAWHFDRKFKKKAAAYDIFKQALTYSFISEFDNICRGGLLINLMQIKLESHYFT